MKPELIQAEMAEKAADQVYKDSKTMKDCNKYLGDKNKACRKAVFRRKK